MQELHGEFLVQEQRATCLAYNRRESAEAFPDDAPGRILWERLNQRNHCCILISTLPWVVMNKSF